MGKRLEDRSLEELWQLFPIFLVPYKKEWAGWYREEKDRLDVLLDAGRIKRVSHIGSTACFRYLGQKYHRYPVRSAG
jgi:hypothetical protein